jgi:hypothetical protein
LTYAELSVVQEDPMAVATGQTVICPQLNAHVEKKSNVVENVNRMSYLVKHQPYQVPKILN